MANETPKTVEVRLLQNINGKNAGDVASFDAEYVKRMAEGVDYLKDASDKAYEEYKKKKQ